MPTKSDRAAQHALADKIASEHGCEIIPSTVGVPVLQVQRRYQQGFPRDGQRVSACFGHLRSAGVNTHGWLS